MRLAKAPARAKREELIPLINLVFLLLVFFMLAGTIVPPERLAVTPPASTSRQPAEYEEPLVLLAADGRLALEGAVLDDEALARALARRLAGREPALAKLKADGTVSSGRLVEVMALLREAGVRRITLFTAADGA